MNRREFLGGALAAGGFWAVPGAVAAASPVRLRFGVVSDVHVREGGPRDHSTGGDTWYFSKALRYFKDRKVDAVLIAGDIADAGRDSEMESVAKAWFEVFPEGCGVEKLFVSGNHDWGGQGTIAKMSALWERVWREPYVSLWHKTVKGYHFIGKHWDSNGFGGLAAWLKENGGPLKGEKPFFYVQHPHPKDTCNGAYAWGRDGGATTAALADWPNAVAFSGHSHHAQTDERSIWQGAFTSINTGSLRYGCHPDDGGLPGRGYENGVKGPDDKLMGPCNVCETKTGLLVEVSDDAIVYARRDFQNDRPLGPDWVQPLPAKAQAPAMGFAERAAKETPPAFAPDAAISAKDVKGRPRKGAEVDAVEVGFPAANASATRAFVYEVRVTGDGEPLVREVVAEGFDQAAESAWANKPSRVVLAKSWLPKGGKLEIAVTPVSSLGVRGKALIRKLG
ncbi:MAG: metallophosphoesterase [Kiritimatiellae bacterium]|nr:metallophosphoesterase [Kiritimatiellia bacterium]